MSEDVDVAREKLEELFAERMNMTSEDFMNGEWEIVLKSDLFVIMCIEPMNQYPIKKEVTIKKGCTMKLAPKSYGSKLQPLGAMNYFYIDIVDCQISDFGELYVKLETFLAAVN